MGDKIWKHNAEDKTTDPDQIARGVAVTVSTLLNVDAKSRTDFDNFNTVVQEIAAALREYGEEQYDQANKDFDWLQSAVGKIYCNLTNNKLSKWNTDPALLMAEVADIQNELIEQADAEGYRRGLNERSEGIADCGCKVCANHAPKQAGFIIHWDAIRQRKQESK